ncbi:MAG: hypothetical protein O7J95_00585 [Planctomycetota bacterium]|nr:hypothetical protein [Planctomycetota bacterium]
MAQIFTRGAVVFTRGAVRRVRDSGGLWLCTVLAFFAGCKVAPPPVRRETTFAVVYGNSSDEVARVSRWVEEFHPRIRELLPQTRNRHPEIWVQKKLAVYRSQRMPDYLDGFLNGSRDRIQVRRDVECLEQTVCHELIHALLDDSWSALPAIVEEGLCEVVSMEVVAGCARLLRAQRLLGAASYLGEVTASAHLKYTPSAGRHFTIQLPVRFTREHVDSLPPLPALRLAGNSLDILSEGIELNHYHYSFGMWIVERIVQRGGYDGLHRLCREAVRDGLEQIPPERLLEAARLGPPESWQREILQGLDGDDLRRVVAGNHYGVAVQAARWLRRVSRGRGSPGEILDHCRFLFRFDVAGPEISLLDLPEFRQLLRDRLGG